MLAVILCFVLPIVLVPPVRAVVRTNYSYSPYGEVSISGDVTQTIQWSSEYPDSEIALVYYNYRYYIPENGCWIRRDPLYETASLNCYSYVDNRPITSTDKMGLARLTINACTSLKVELVTKGFWGYDRTEISNGSTLHIRDAFNIIITSMWKTSDKCQKEKENYFKCFPYNVETRFTYGNAAWQSYFTGSQYRTILSLSDRNEISMGTAVFANAGNSNPAVASGGFYVRRSQLLKKASININIFVIPGSIEYNLNYNVVFDNKIGSLDFDSHYVTN